MKPNLSFVIATKNRGALIGETLESLLSQTMPEWEALVIEDHSDPSDKTKEVISGLGDSRIKYHQLPDSAGRGVSCARNYGNLHANSPIIAVQDSDDISEPKRAELILESYKSNCWDVFYGDFLVFSDSPQDASAPKTHPEPFQADRYLDGHFFIPHSSSAYTKHTALHYPYNSAFSRGEDLDFFSRLALDKKKFHFCPEVIYRYRVHQESISQGKGDPQMEQFIRELRAGKQTK